MYVCAPVLTMLSLFIKIVLIGITGASNHDPNTMAVVINKDSSKLEDYIQIRNPPSTIKGHRVVVEYRCTHDRIVGLEVQTDIEHQSAQKVFQKIWKCRASLDKGATKLKRIKLKLPPAIQNNYNIFNKQVKFTSKTKIRAWILERDWWPSCFKQRNCYTRSSVKVAYDTKIPSPFSRPYIHVGKDCRKWSWDVLTFMTSYKIPTCPVEAEIVEVIEYPVVIGGNPYGVYRKLHPYKNPELEEKRKAMFHKPRFTISIWLYILEYCPGTEHSGKLCSIMFHSNWKMEYRTLLFFITPEGRFHIQIQHTDGQTSAGVTNSAAPLHQWIRVVLTFNTNMWSIVINHGEEFNETQESSYTHPGTAVFMDDTEGLFSFGGAEHVHGFRGYIGQASYYRNMIVDHKKIPFPSRYHPMFELKLTRREERCKNYIDWVNQRVNMYKKRLRRAFLKSRCHRYLIELIKNITHPKKLPYCKPNACKSKHWSLVDRIVKRLVSTGEQIDFRLVADELYSNATQLLDESLHNIPAAFPILKQAACYGNNDAMYMVSVILNNGIHVKADEIQSQAYLMLAALENHRLSALALGHKHRYGIDGVPLDFEQSYGYFKYVADTTRIDKEIHKDTDVYTESIRLTDEVALHEQTDENGDIFHWLKHQAQQGVLSAQHKVGRALFWGSQGLQRNMNAAIEYFKMSADTGDSQSQYDYGIVLLRGQGTKKNVNEGLKQLHKAAEQKNPAAINAIGWHAMAYEKDYVKAAEHFEKAYRMNNADAAYNLGILYLHGNYPGKAKDADTALQYFFFAGSREQIDSGVAIAYQTIKGTDRQERNVYTAVEWARFIAEKNPAIGYVLRKGIQAYRKGKRDVSLFYYALAADAGLEVGSFNFAWLCEENTNGVVSFIEKDCVWRQFNISTHREMHFVDSYSLIKMGDYYWYGCEGHRNVTKAVHYYSEAAKKNDPHALFNIGFMFEEGARVPRSILDDINVPRHVQKDNMTVLEHLYTRCKDSHKSEAFIPCSIALWRIQFVDVWNKYQILIKVTSFTGVAAMAAVSSYVLLRYHIRGQPPITDTI